MMNVPHWPPPLDSQRATPPPPPAFRAWAEHLFRALKALNRTPVWLGMRVGYRNPKSMHQVVNGHQGVSRAVYEAILRYVPAMRLVAPPPIRRERKGRGAFGPHKPHEYPEDVARRVARW